MKSEAMERLRAADPVLTARTEGWTSGAESNAILEAIVSSPPRSARRSRALSRSRLVTVAASVVAASVVASLIFLPGRHHGTEASAAEVLRDIAVVAESDQQTTAGPGEFVYTRSKDAYMSATVVGDGDQVTAMVEHEREIWIANDGSGRLRVRSGQPYFLGDRDRERWEAGGRPDLGNAGVSDETFGPEGLAPTDFSTYPTDTDALYERIRRDAEGHGSSVDSEMLVLVGDLLRETAAPPDLRAALFRVAARIPGVELVGDVKDPAGRSGTAVGRTSDDDGFRERVELIFDPDTSELLAEREVLLERVDWIDAEPGTVIGWAVYLDHGVTDSVQERP